MENPTAKTERVTTTLVYKYTVKYKVDYYQKMYFINKLITGHVIIAMTNTKST